MQYYTANMEFAVIKTGGKQYVVASGDLITIEKLGRRSKTQELKRGDAVTFEEVLLTDDGKKTVVGTPMVAGAKVTGTVFSVGRGPKVETLRYKPKSNFSKRIGHRQPFVKVKIDKVA